MSRQAYYENLRPMHLAPLWEVLKSLVTPQPVTSCVPAHWRYANVRPYLQQAGELITAAEAERRVLILENPALPGHSTTTRTLYAGLQLILPGEVAPCHRHTQSALRFIMEGTGAFTAVDGEKCYMNRWDLILTPPWHWHDHGNETNAPMVWLDGLDIPLITALDVSFAESLPGRQAHPETAPPASSTFVYPYAVWRENLERLRHIAWNAHHGVRTEFSNKVDGGSIMPTISAYAQLIPASRATQPLRSTDGGIYAVVEGQGQAHIGEKTFDLEVGDVFVVPAWQSRRFAASSDLVMFSFSDKATHEKLGLWREQRM